MRRVLVLSHDKVGAEMAGPGIRYHYIAKELSKHFETSLGVYHPDHIAGQPKGLPYRSIHVDAHQFHKAFDNHDVIFALWLSEAMIAYAKQKNKILVFDLYAPVPVETLIGQAFSGKTLGPADDLRFDASLQDYARLLHYGDFFVCSNPRQRDFWLGYAFASGVFDPSHYQVDQFDERVSFAPMGIDDSSLPDIEPILRTKLGLSQDDVILVWTGGIWDWFDAKTVIQAMAKQSQKQIKLVFLGTKHPNDDIPLMSETVEARKLSDELDLTGKTVFFLDGWIPYDERLAYLADADAAIFAHKSELEARFSHRTRVLDHILIGLPTIATIGDFLTEVIERDGVGLGVPVGNVEAMAAAISEISKPDVRKKMLNRLAEIRPQYYWSATLEPLIGFIDRPNRRPVSDSNSVPTVRNLPWWYPIARKMPGPIRKAGKYGLLAGRMVLNRLR